MSQMIHRPLPACPFSPAASCVPPLPADPTHQLSDCSFAPNYTSALKALAEWNGAPCYLPLGCLPDSSAHSMFWLRCRLSDPPSHSTSNTGTRSAFILHPMLVSYFWDFPRKPFRWSGPGCECCTSLGRLAGPAGPSCRAVCIPGQWWSCVLSHRYSPCRASGLSEILTVFPVVSSSAPSSFLYFFHFLLFFFLVPPPTNSNEEKPRGVNYKRWAWGGGDGLGG